MILNDSCLPGWIDTLNFVAASLSAPPLPSACGSRKKFQRPLMPASITKLNLVQQVWDIFYESVPRFVSFVSLQRPNPKPYPNPKPHPDPKPYPNPNPKLCPNPKLDPNPKPSPNPKQKSKA